MSFPFLRSLSFPKAAHPRCRTRHQRRLTLESLEHRQLLAADPLLSVALEVAQDSTGMPFLGPVEVGDTFYLNVYVQDLRTTPETHGVLGGAIDVAWTPALATASSTLEFSASFSDSQSGTVNNADADQVNEAGALTTTEELGSGYYELLFSVQLTATAEGTLFFSANPGEGGATIDPAQFRLVGLDSVPWDQVDFDTSMASLTIGSIPPQGIDDAYSVPQGAQLVTSDVAGITPDPSDDGVLANDIPGDYLDIQAIVDQQPTHGTLSLHSDGTFEYQNDGSSAPMDSFTYRVSDGVHQSDPVTVTISIELADAQPVLTNIESDALAYNEGDPPTPVTSTLTVTDADGTEIAAARVEISNGYLDTEDVLSFTDTATITGSWDSLSGTLTLIGTDTLDAYQAALRSVTYQNTSSNPDPTTRTVAFTVNDGLLDSSPVVRDIQIGISDSAPVLDAVESSNLTYTENAPPADITSTITISDLDNTEIQYATVQIIDNYQSGQDVLSFVNTSNITAAWDAVTGELTLTGTDTLANYQAALRSVRYQNTSDNPDTSPHTVAFSVNDGLLDSVPVLRGIDVVAINDAPVLALVETTSLAYTENASATPITSTITLTDADSTTILGATATITGNYQSGQDVLTFVDTPSITGTWNATTGILTLTGADSLDAYQTALRSVTYQNTSDTPSTLPRTVTFLVNDGLVDSNGAVRSISVTAVNDIPVLDNIEPDSLAVTENDPATVITSNLAISDLDNTQLHHATVQITANYQNGQDVLSFVNTGTITGSWNPANGRLTLTGIDTLAAYEAALRSVKYQNTSENPSTAARTITFKASDGTDESGALARLVTLSAVNDGPSLAGIETTSLAFAAGEAAKAVSSTITPSDADSTTLAGATVQITGNYLSGEDVLSFVNTSKITGSWDAATGTLTLTGTDTLANYQAALRSVKYQDTAATPNTLTRTVSFQVTDGTDTSATVARDIAVSLTPPAPPENSVSLVADPLAPGKTVLYVYATNKNDQVVINPGRASGDVKVTVNGKLKGTFHPTSRIVVHGLKGNDSILVSSSVTVPAWLYGDDGNDGINAGRGLSLLLGGTGNDTLWGGKGRSLLIGGTGADRLYAGAGESILIGDTTDYDANDQALAAILNEWNSSSAYATRVSHLAGPSAGANDTWFLNATTVHGDGARDTLTGGSALDLFFAELNDRPLARRAKEKLVTITRA